MRISGGQGALLAYWSGGKQDVDGDGQDVVGEEVDGDGDGEDDDH